jgi:sugar/nucleoside kinase (ribokinase family)
MSEKKILCFGEIAWDRTWRLSDLPRAGLDGHLISEYEGPGGCALNSAYMLASCGISVALAGNFIGADSRGDLIHDYIQKAGIEDLIVSRNEKPTPLNQCLVAESSGERSFILFHDGIQDWSPTLLGSLQADLQAGMFLQVFVQPYFSAGARHLLTLIPDGIWILAQEIESDSELVPSIDALQLSLDEKQTFSPAKITSLARTFFRGRLREIFFTHGARGVWYQKINSTPVFFPAHPVEKVVDTTGCGDAFRAGLMSGLLKGMSMEDAIGLGQKFGALKAQIRGSHCKGLI